MNHACSHQTLPSNPRDPSLLKANSHLDPISARQTHHNHMLPHPTYLPIKLPHGFQQKNPPTNHIPPTYPMIYLQSLSTLPYLTSHPIPQASRQQALPSISILIPSTCKCMQQPLTFPIIHHYVGTVARCGFVHAWDQVGIAGCSKR